MLKFVFLLFVCLALFGKQECAKKDAKEIKESREAREFREAQEARDVQMSQAINCFSLSFYRQLSRSAGNMACSPFTTYFQLTTLLGGATNNTADQMHNAMKCKDIPYQDVKDCIAKKRSGISAINGSNFITTNSLWMQQTSKFKPQYLDKVKNQINSEIFFTDFTKKSSKSQETVNNWVSNKTNGIIQGFLNEEPERNTMVLSTAATVLKIKWHQMFNKTLTKKAPFYNNAWQDDVSSVSFMNKRDTMKYKLNKGPNVEVLEIDCFQRNQAVILMLPANGTTLDEVEKAWDCDTFRNMTRNLQEKLVDCSLPKCVVASGVDWKIPLMNMGITDAFTDKANFTAIAPSLKLSKGLQKTAVIFDEDGGELESPKSKMMNTKIGPENKPIYLNFNRPFLFAYYDKGTGMVLTLGRVQNL